MHRAACSLTVLSLSLYGAPALADTFEVVTAFDPALGELPESVTLDDDGNIYLSMANTVRKRTPAGRSARSGPFPSRRRSRSA